jgi:hypothetical protein
MTCRVFVFARPLSNVGDRSLAAMWVIGETLQLQWMNTDIERSEEELYHVLHPCQYGSGRA